MVRVESLTQEDIDRRERKSRLVNITRNIVGRLRTFDGKKTSFINVSSYPFCPFSLPIQISLMGTERRVFVSNPKFFDTAMKLARAYEESGEGQFTVKKEYLEELEVDEGVIDSSPYAT